MRPRAPLLQAVLAFLSKKAQERWDFFFKRFVRYHPFFEEKWPFIYIGTGSLGVSLGRRPPKKYRGRAKVRTRPFWGSSIWQSIFLA